MPLRFKPDLASVPVSVPGLFASTLAALNPHRTLSSPRRAPLLRPHFRLLPHAPRCHTPPALICPDKSTGGYVAKRYPSAQRKQKFGCPRDHIYRPPMPSELLKQEPGRGSISSCVTSPGSSANRQTPVQFVQSRPTRQCVPAFGQLRRTFLDPMWPFENPGLCSEATPAVTDRPPLGATSIPRASLLRSPSSWEATSDADFVNAHGGIFAGLDLALRFYRWPQYEPVHSSR